MLMAQNPRAQEPHGESLPGRPEWFRDPNIDIFVASEVNDTVQFLDPKFLPRMKMPANALRPLQKVPFGETWVSAHMCHC